MGASVSTADSSQFFIRYAQQKANMIRTSCYKLPSSHLLCRLSWFGGRTYQFLPAQTFFTCVRYKVRHKNVLNCDFLKGSSKTDWKIYYPREPFKPFTEIFHPRQNFCIVYRSVVRTLSPPLA